MNDDFSLSLYYSLIFDYQRRTSWSNQPVLDELIIPSEQLVVKNFFVPENFLDQGIKRQDVSPLLLMPSLYLTVPRMSRTFSWPGIFSAQLGWSHLSFINANEQAVLPHS